MRNVQFGFEHLCILLIEIEGWKYGSGFVSDQMMKEQFFPPSDDPLVLMCGPPPMINFACIPNLDKLGYDAVRRFAY